MGRRGAGEHAVYQRASDDLWVCAIDLGWQTGRRVRKTVSAKTKREALAKLRKLQADLERGVLTDSATVAEWLTYWLDHVATIKPQTRRSYESKIKTWINPAVGKRRLDQLRPEHIRALLADMRHAGRSDAHRRQTYAILHRALVVAERDGRIPFNPAARVEPPSVGSGSHGKLDIDEARAVIAVLASGFPRSTRWACALLQGLRQGEALGMRWEAIDLDHGTLTIERTVERRPGQGLVVSTPKSSRSARTLPLLPWIATALTAERQDQGYVWGADPETPWSPERDWRQWHTLLEAADVPKRPLHAARATTASLLMAANVPDVVIMEIMGHSQVAVTQRHYMHGDHAMHRDAIGKLARLIGPDG